MSMQWFYKIMGEEFGPCSAAELREQAALGNILADSLVRKSTEGQWVSAWRVNGLIDPKPDQQQTRATSETKPPLIVEVAPATLLTRPPPLPPPIRSITNPPPKPKPKKIRRWVTALVMILAAMGAYTAFRGSKASINPIQSFANSGLQSKLDRAIRFDQRNSGIDISVYYGEAFNKSVVVFDLQGISESNSRLDVFRVLLDFAEKMQEDRCDKVELAFRGETKFQIDGDYFQALGRERDIQNPAYTIRTFPENLKTTTGLRAYPEWTGGLIGVLNKQMEDFNDFHNKWYLDELTSSK